MANWEKVDEKEHLLGIYGFGKKNENTTREKIIIHVSS